MIKLQNNYTNPEQSKRLLELGVPADSADFFYDLEANNPPHANHVPWFLDTTYSELSDEFGLRAFLPCWSVGRLIEIYELCTGNKFKRITDKKGNLIYVILLYDVLAQIEYSIVNSVDGVKWDFSKLED